MMHKSLSAAVRSLLPSLSLFFTSLSAGTGISLPNEYQHNSGPQWEWAMEALKKLSFNDTDKILDVGCGDGKITAFIASQYPNAFLVGLDLSPQMVQHASQRFHKNNLLFLQGNATSIPFTQQFDKLISLCTMHWVLEQQKALECFKNSLKPGGILLITAPLQRVNSLGPVSEEIVRLEKWAPYFPHFKQQRQYSTADEFKSLLEEVGLKLISLDIAQSILTFENKETFLAYVRPLVDFAAHLPEDLKEDFINDIVNTQILRADAISPTGAISFKTEKMDIIAFNP